MRCGANQACCWSGCCRWCYNTQPSLVVLRALCAIKPKFIRNKGFFFGAGHFDLPRRHRKAYRLCGRRSRTCQSDVGYHFRMCTAVLLPNKLSINKNISWHWDISIHSFSARTSPKECRSRECSLVFIWSTTPVICCTNILLIVLVLPTLQHFFHKNMLWIAWLVGWVKQQAIMVKQQCNHAMISAIITAFFL